MADVRDGYVEDLDERLPGAKARLDELDKKYGDNLPDAVHDALMFYLGVEPDEETDTGTRLQDFVRAAMFSVDQEWLEAEVRRMRG